MKIPTSSHRLSYLDWVRGIGAIIMLQGHVFDSFLRDDLRKGDAYVLSQFFGGMPPAIFLFLTGVTFAFLMDSSQKRGLDARSRMFEAFRRSGYLFALAVAFRVQLWIFGMPAPWQNLFKVDILNAMGFAIAVLSPLAFFRTAERARLSAIVGLAIAFAAPLISQIDWSGTPWMLRAYIVPDGRYFGFFPWAAFLAFGLSAGSILRLAGHEHTERAMQWAAILGGALILASGYFANSPYSIYSKAEYWLNSPALILTKLGVFLLLLAFAFVWTRYAAGEGWSWVRQLGTTSLLVYWVHIELVYGKGLWFLKNSLNVTQTLIAAFFVILLMLAISTIKTYRRQVQTALADLGWMAPPETDTAAGD